jgi:hypothetical protein
MNKRALCAAVATVLSCSGGLASPALAAPATSGSPQVESSTSGPLDRSADPVVRADIDAVLAALPSGWQAAAARSAARLPDGYWRSLRDGAINGADDRCRPTAMSDWMNQQFAAIDPGALPFLFKFGVFDMPTADALFFETDATPQYFGADGDRTLALTHEMRDLQRFWDVSTGDVQLVAMHNDFVDPPDKVLRTTALVYGPALGPDGVARLAQALIALAHSSGLAGNPVLTANAFAFTGAGTPGLEQLPDKIVVGDGILQAVDHVGLGQTGARAILAHEFAHHVQYEDDLFASPLPGPEASRRTELMADAFGTYSLTHKRGEALNAKRLLDAEQSFYGLGDCVLTDPAHHGTPNQRLRASARRAGIAAGQQKQGHVMPSLALAGLFEQELPQLVAPGVR